MVRLDCCAVAYIERRPRGASRAALDLTGNEKISANAHKKARSDGGLFCVQPLR